MVLGDLGDRRFVCVRLINKVCPSGVAVRGHGKSTKGERHPELVPPGSYCVSVTRNSKRVQSRLLFLPFPQGHVSDTLGNLRVDLG